MAVGGWRAKSRKYPDGDGKRSGVDPQKDEPGGGIEWAIRFVSDNTKKNRIKYPRFGVRSILSYPIIPFSFLFFILIIIKKKILSSPIPSTKFRYHSCTFLLTFPYGICRTLLNLPNFFYYSYVVMVN